jgi:hypothetical protein
LIDRSGLGWVTDIQANDDGKYPNIWTMAENKEYMVVEKVVEKFQNNLRSGTLDPEYRADAMRAGFRRRRGDFKQSLEEEPEESSSSSEESSEGEEVEEDFEHDSENKIHEHDEIATIEDA